MTEEVWVANIEDDDMDEPLIIVASTEEALQKAMREGYGSEVEGDFDEWFEWVSKAASVHWDLYRVKEEESDEPGD